MAADGEADGKEAVDSDLGNVIDGLKSIYKDKIRPIEEAFRFDLFFSPYLEDVDFEAKPIVLLLGQYSVGKTTFIRHLIKRDFPGIRIGPEPTTDRFVAVMHGESDQVIPGNALCVDAQRPFRALNKFGIQFLNRFEASICNSKTLESVTFVDTPGVLSGEKQRIGRQYDFGGVIHWFASRSDRILLLFDAHKLDVSDEFKRTIESLRGHEDKVRVVLNKADSVDPKQLIRVFGALMWSLGKVVRSPEAVRVYLGSFWDQPLNENHDCYNLFKSEMADLLSDLRSLPRNSAIRKINELVKRARLARVHAHILSELRTKMPTFWGKSKKQAEILDNLPNEFNMIAKRHGIPPGDFPNMVQFRKLVEDLDLAKFPKLGEKLLKPLDEALGKDVPQLMAKMNGGDPKKRGSSIDRENPFAASAMDSDLDQGWVVSCAEKTESDNLFQTYAEGGTLRGANAKACFATTGLGHEVLYRIWALCDISKTNALDADEFALAMFLVKLVKSGQDLPEQLPSSYIPPSKRVF